MRRADVLVAGAVAAWLGLECFALGPFSAVILHDTGDCTLPHWLALASGGASARGAWWPLEMSGVDRLANDLPLDHLPLGLFLALPGWLAWNLTAFLLPFIAFLGTTRLCSDQGSSEKASWAAGGAYAVVVTTGLVLKSAWGWAVLPAALCAFERALRQPFVRSLVLSAVLGAILALSSSPALNLPFLLAAFVAWVWARRRVSGRSTSCLFVLILTAAALRYPLLQIMWSQAPFSQRGSAPAGIPSFFGALSAVEYACLAAACAGACFTRKAVKTRLWILAAAFILAPTLARSLIAFVEPRLDALKTFGFDRFFAIVPLWAACAAAAGLDGVSARARNAAFALFAVILIGQSLAFKAVVARGWLYEGSYAALYRAPTLRSLPRAENDPYRVATVPHGLQPAYATAYTLESTDGYLNLYSGRYRRFWEEVLEPTFVRDEAARTGFAISPNGAYLQLARIPEAGRPLDFSEHWRLDLLSLAGTRYLISRVSLADPALTLVRAGTLPEDGTRRERLMRRLRRNFGGDDGLFVYENGNAFPRAFVVPRATSAASSGAAFSALRAARLPALRTAVVVESLPGPVAGKGGTARIASYSPDRVVLKLSPGASGVLVATIPWTQGWRGQADGVPVRVLPAWGAFQAVVIPPGAKEIVLSYGADAPATAGPAAR